MREEQYVKEENGKVFFTKKCLSFGEMEESIWEYNNTRKEVEDAWIPEPIGDLIQELDMLSLMTYNEDGDLISERRKIKGGFETKFFHNGILTSHERENEFDKDYDDEGVLEDEIHYDENGEKHGVEAHYEDGVLKSYFVFEHGKCIQAGKDE